VSNFEPFSRAVRRAALCFALGTSVSTATAAPPDVEPTSVSVAAPAPPERVEPLGETIAAHGQPALALARRGPSLVATLCKGAACAWDQAIDLGAPPEVVGALDAKSIGELRLSATRKALSVWVTVAERRYRAIVAAPVLARSADPSSARPVVAFAGYTGYDVNEDGERVGRDVRLFENERGVTDVVIGELDDALQLCGRDTLLSPKVFHAEELRLRGIKFQRLAQAERDAAPRLTGVVNSTPTQHRVLRARGASSALGSPLALTDGDPSTYWAEKRGGDGSGEFVVLSAPPSLPITALNLQLRPSLPEGQAPNSSAPSALWLVLDESVFHVSLPERAWGLDASGKPVTVSVALPSPVKTSCVGVVLDGTPPEQAPKTKTPKGEQGADIDVTIAEISAETQVSAADVAAAAAALGGPAGAAQAAQELLVAFGEGGQRAVAKHFGKLEEVGRLRALAILDDAHCSLAAPAYARSVDGSGSALHEHGARGLKRCGKAALPAIERLALRAKGERFGALGSALLDLDPLAAFDLSAKRLEQASAPVRARLRALIAEALTQPVVIERARALLAAGQLGKIAAIDVLRAAGTDVVKLQPAAARVVLGLLASAPQLRTRYLLIEPLAVLATVDPQSEAALLRLLNGDESPYVRMRAAQVAPGRDSVTAALLRAAEDDSVRVREAAVDRLADYRVVAATPVLLRHVEADKWPLVRAASVRALGELPKDERVLKVLADTAELDTSAEVRRPAVFALAAAGARQHLGLLRQVYEDDEDPYVQAAAASALGRLCDRHSLDALTASARKLAVLGNSERDTILARASLSALGQLNPPDLEQRLAVFFGPDVNVLARGAADLAKRHPEPCPR
jgi:hypothetical protein